MNPTRHAYRILKAKTDNPSWGVGVGGETRRRSLAAYQTAVAEWISRLIGPAPSPPVVRRSILGTTSGLRLTKADVTYSWYHQPGLRRGPITQRHCFLYSFKTEAGRTYSLNCFPPSYGDSGGNSFDAALDELARSIRLPQATPER